MTGLLLRASARLAPPKGGKRRQREPRGRLATGKLRHRCRHRFYSNRARAGLVGLRQMFVRRRQLCRHTKEAQAEVRYREKLLAELDAKEAVDGKH